MPTLYEQWADMSDELTKKQQTYIDCLSDLFRDGSRETLAQCEQLRVDLERYREHMYDVIGGHTSCPNGGSAAHRLGGP